MSAPLLSYQVRLPSHTHQSCVCVCVSALSCVRFHSDPAVLDHQKKVQYVKPVVAAPVNARNSKAGKRQKPNADVANVVMIE